MHKISKIVIALAAIVGLATACDASSAQPGKVVEEKSDTSVKGSGSGGVEASEKDKEEKDEEPSLPQVGDTVTVGDWDVKITDINRDASAVIERANMFNDRAKGVYVLVTYDATYHGNQRMGEPEMDLTWTITTPDNKVQDAAMAVTPSDDEEWPAQTRKGGTVTEQVAFDIKGEVGGSIVSAEEWLADEYADFQMAP